MKTTNSTKGSLGLALVVAIAGVLCFTAVPIMAIRAMDAVLAGAAIKIPASGNPLIATAPRIVIAFFPFWAGLSAAAGVALLFAAWGVYRGEAWAKPVAVGLLVIPSITGAYYSGPIMFFGKSALPIFIIIALIGLIPYFTILLSDKAPAGQKVGKFFLFLMLGVTAAWSFANGGSSLRMFWARPDPYMLDMSNYGFIFGIPILWTGVLATIIAIPLLAAYMRLGWRMALVGLGIIFLGNTFLFITHTGTKEFMIGLIMAVISLVLLSIPGIGGLYGQPKKEQDTSEKPAGVLQSQTA
jgi:hypothetical protein